MPWVGGDDSTRPSCSFCCSPPACGQPCWPSLRSTRTPTFDLTEYNSKRVKSFPSTWYWNRIVHPVIAWRCSECDVSLESPPEGVEANLHGTQMMSAHSDEETTLQLTARSEISETMTLMRLVNVEDVQTNNRPSPTQTSIQHRWALSCCERLFERLIGEFGDRRRPHQQRFPSAGVALSSNDHHLVFDVLGGDSLEWQWLASTSVAVEMYHQTTSGELLLNGTHRSGEAHAEVGDTPQQPGYWVAPEDGRFVAFVHRGGSCDLGGQRCRAPSCPFTPVTIPSWTKGHGWWGTIQPSPPLTGQNLSG